MHAGAGVDHRILTLQPYSTYSGVVSTHFVALKQDSRFSSRSDIVSDYFAGLTNPPTNNVLPSLQGRPLSHQGSYVLNNQVRSISTTSTSPYTQ